MALRQMSSLCKGIDTWMPLKPSHLTLMQIDNNLMCLCKWLTSVCFPFDWLIIRIKRSAFDECRQASSCYHLCSSQWCVVLIVIYVFFHHHACIPLEQPYLLQMFRIQHVQFPIGCSRYHSSAPCCYTSAPFHHASLNGVCILVYEFPGSQQLRYHTTGKA